MKSILFAALVGYAASCFAQDGPAVNKRFSLPLADGTTAEAVFLPAHDDGLHLVYATRFGKLVILHVTEKDATVPPDPPDPPVPVVSLNVGVVHAPTKSTVIHRQVMADPAWRAGLHQPHKFCGIIPFDYVDPNTMTTPDAQAVFIKAAGETPLPCLVLLNENFKKVFVCPLPASAAEILKLVEKYGGKTNVKTSDRRGKLRTSHHRTSATPRLSGSRLRAGMLPTPDSIRPGSTRSHGHGIDTPHSSRGMARPDPRRQGNLAA